MSLKTQFSDINNKLNFVIHYETAETAINESELIQGKWHPKLLGDKKIETSLSIIHLAFGVFGFLFALGFYLLVFSKGEEAIVQIFRGI